MITLYSFGPAFGVPDPSPFCMKAEVLLKMSGRPYRIDTTGFLRAPKGKQPYIEDDGEIVADSTFIRWHLERKYGIDFDAGLDTRRRGVAWAIEKLCEDNIYWVIMRERWLVGDNFAKGPRRFFDRLPFFIRPIARAKALRDVRSSLWRQGIGRHSVDDGRRIGIAGIAAVAGALGDDAFIGGDHPCGADAAVFAFATGALALVFEGPLLEAARSHANLVAYRDRCMARWYPGFKPA